MATLTLSAKISILDGKNSTLTNASINLPLTNVSSDLDSVLGFKRVVKNNFIINLSSANSKHNYYNELNYVIVKQLSDKNNGRFTQDIILTLNGNNLDHFLIDFDTKNNGYPTYLIVDGTRYENDSATFSVANLVGNTHEVVIQDWNRYGYPCVISGIYTELSINIDYKNLISLERTLKDRFDDDNPNFGVVSTNGSIKFNDNHKEILEYANMNYLNSNSTIELFLNEKLSNTTIKVGEFKASKWNYDVSNFVVDISFNDDLLEWQDIIIDNLDLELNKSAKYLYDKLVEITPSKFSFEPLSDEVEQLLNSISIKYFYINKTNLWAMWNYLCDLALLRLYKNDNGKIEVKK